MNKKQIFLLILFLLSISISFSQVTEIKERILNVMCNFYDLLRDILPVAVVAVIILAAIVFSIGQILGAETRARANVWATNMMIMTIVAVLVVYIVPWIIDQIAPELGVSKVCGGR